MRNNSLAVALAALSIAATTASAQDASRTVAGGGVSVPGWTGKIDANEAAKGATLDGSKLMPMGTGMHVTTGPAVAYWHPSNTAKGDYTVKATFDEPSYMNLNSHPHPYGIMIAGNDMGTDQQSYLYCAAYGNGNFIVRGFGPAPFQMNGGRGGPAPSIAKAAAKGDPVKQVIALSVKGDKVECSVNGAVVGSYDKASLIGPGKLKSLDGVYGIRFGHNTEAMVSDFAMTKP